MGAACSNKVRVARKRAQNVLLGKLRDDLLAPASVKQITQDTGILARTGSPAESEGRRGAAGNSRASLKARVMLREAYEGEIKLVPDEAAGLPAHWNLRTTVLLRGLGSAGSGGVIANGGLPAIPLRRKASQICAPIRAASEGATAGRLYRLMLSLASANRKYVSPNSSPNASRINAGYANLSSPEEPRRTTPS